jgi:hypothetical protein
MKLAIALAIVQAVLMWRGEWKEKTQYYINDVVRDDHNIVYVAIKDSKDVKPDPRKSEPWTRMSK